MPPVSELVFEENVMKIKNEIDASETNMRDIEIPTLRMVENPKADICAAIKNIIQDAKPKLSCLDPLPTPLLKNTLPAHIQILTHVTYLNIT